MLSADALGADGRGVGRPLLGSVGGVCAHHLAGWRSGSRHAFSWLIYARTALAHARAMTPLFPSAYLPDAVAPNPSGRVHSPRLPGQHRLADGWRQVHT